MIGLDQSLFGTNGFSADVVGVGKRRKLKIYKYIFFPAKNLDGRQQETSSRPIIELENLKITARIFLARRG